MVYLKAASSEGIRKLLSNWLGMEETETIRTAAYVFSMHDIGKAHPAFLFQVEEIKAEWVESGYCDMTRYIPETNFRHEAYSEVVVKQYWEENGLFPKKVSEMLAAVIHLHHQGKNEDSNKKCGRIGEPWLGIQNDLELRMRKLFCPKKIESEEQVINRDALGVLLTGLLVLSDWVASSERFGFCDPNTDDVSCRTWALARAYEVLKAYGLISDQGEAFPRQNEFDAFWRQISRENMRPLQKACERIGGQSALLTIIEAPPGEGKTEAALYLAGQLCKAMDKRGIYMALPTMATSNQMVGRVRALMRSHDLGETRLLHGSAWMLDDISTDAAFSMNEDAVEAANWLRPLRRALLSENAVGTVDQAMAAVLKVKYGMLRLTGLANKVLIVDEIHAYDVYMTRILVCLMQWCRAMRIPVILLSATLHRRQKEDYLRCFTDAPLTEDLQAYPLITRVDMQGRVNVFPVEGTYMRTECQYRTLPLLDDAEKLVRHILERTRNGGCYCVMLNTVGRAQQVYRALREAGETQVMLFHARFRMRRRAEIEEECLRVFGRGGDRPKRMILVCTQVVEQSLDLDFDGMISELAPIDLLIQRAGRVHRHAENVRPEGMRRPVLEVLVPTAVALRDPEKRYGVLSAVYETAELKNTEEWLDAGRTVRIPEDVRAAIDEVYEKYNPKDLELYVSKQVKENASRVNAEGCIYREPKENKFFGTLPNQRESLLLSDPDDSDLIRKGARTREGDDTRRVAFLPADFECSGSKTDCAKRILLESASIRLTKRKGNDKNEDVRYKEIQNKYLRGCEIVQPETDGTYIVEGRKYIADDEVGIYEVKET